MTQQTTSSKQPVNRRRFLSQTSALAGLATVGGGMLIPTSAMAAPDPMSPKRLHRWVRELCEFQPRWAGYEAEKQAGEWLANRLRKAGVPTEIVPYAFRKWQLNDWRVTLLNGRDAGQIKCFPMWSTKGGKGVAEMVDVGSGSQSQLESKNIRGKAIVVTGKALLNVFATYRETYQRAAELGAVAMFVTSDAPDNLIRPTSSSQNRLDDNAIPAFHLGAKDLAKLRRSARWGGNIAWHLDAQHEPGTTHDVIGTLPGSGQLPGAIMVCAHYDAWFTGALDNATGVAGLIGLAEYFASLPIEKRPRDMIFIGVTGHDAGYPHLGMSNWIATHQDKIPDLDLFMNLDHLAAQGEEHISGLLGAWSNFSFSFTRPGDEERVLFTTKHPTLARLFKPHLRESKLLALRLSTVPELTANGDLEGAMGDLGVPSVNLTMATPHYHTIMDTPDRVPAEQLARATIAHRDFLLDIIGLERAAIRLQD